jgi:DNA-directed RNA polymerase subunit RPC12/RpoP
MATEPGDKIITYASYYDPMLAHLIRTKLEDNDIPCFVADENFLTANPIYNQAAGGIKLKIFERDLERCKEILAEDDALLEQANAEDLSSDAVICPYCGSTDVRYGSATEKKISWVAAVLSMCLAIFPFFANKAWHCFNCGKDFE